MNTFKEWQELNPQTEMTAADIQRGGPPDRSPDRIKQLEDRVNILTKMMRRLKNQMQWWNNYEWSEGTHPDFPELGFTGGPPVFNDIEDRVEQLENKVDLLMKIVRPETMRIAS